MGGTCAQAGQAVTNHRLEAADTARLLRDCPPTPVLGVRNFILARISTVTSEFQQFFQADTFCKSCGACVWQIRRGRGPCTQYYYQRACWYLGHHVYGRMTQRDLAVLEVERIFSLAGRLVLKLRTSIHPATVARLVRLMLNFDLIQNK